MKRIALTILAAMTALVAAACSGPGAGDLQSSPSSEGHNAADVRFAQEMIAHHRQAIVMADMVDDGAASAEVRDLAERIQQAQGPEIATMTQWLESWGEDVPSDADMMGGDMAGMMSEDTMSQLMGIEGADFDRMFLQMMTAHHEGAIEMARIQQAEGSFAPARDLAAQIEIDQQAEIEEMAQVLGTL